VRKAPVRSISLAIALFKLLRAAQDSRRSCHRKASSMLVASPTAVRHWRRTDLAVAQARDRCQSCAMHACLCEKK